MKYERMEQAIFKSRPNRFLAQVETARGIEICHVKNTGRCKELLTPDAEIWVQRNDSAKRKTALDLIAVKKGTLLVNMDSQIPNKAAEEWIRSGQFQIRRADGTIHRFSQETRIQSEIKYGASRLDLYLEDDQVRMFLEIKGVTLEEDGIARFPDAPTERGIKHVEELIRCMEDGYEAGILFVIQMHGMRFLEPNDRTHPAFGEALRRAKKAGVHVMAAECRIMPDEIQIEREVEVRL